MWRHVTRRGLAEGHSQRMRRIGDGGEIGRRVGDISGRTCREFGDVLVGIRGFYEDGVPNPGFLVAVISRDPLPHVGTDGGIHSRRDASEPRSLRGSAFVNRREKRVNAREVEELRWMEEQASAEKLKKIGLSWCLGCVT